MAKPVVRDGLAPAKRYEMEMVAIDKISSILDAMSPLQSKRVLEFVINAQQERLLEAAQRMQGSRPPVADPQ